MLYWLELLRRPFKLGLFVAMIVALASLFIPNYYRSEAKILPVESKSGLGGLGGNLSTAAAALGVSLPGSEGGDNNFIDILQSRWLGERLLTTEFTFKIRSWRFGAEMERRQTLYTFLKARNMDLGLRSLGKMVSVTRDMKTKVISFSFESRSPSLSKAVVDSAICDLEAFVKGKSQTRGGVKAAFAEARLREAKEELVRAEAVLCQYLEGNRNYLTSADPSVRLKGMRYEADLKLQQQLVATLVVSREQALLEEKNDMPILNVMDEGNFPFEKSWPVRSIYVGGAFLVAAVAVFGFDRKAQIRNWLFDSRCQESLNINSKEIK